MADGDVELDGDLAARADAKAKQTGEDLRAVIERLLREYIDEPEDQ